MEDRLMNTLRLIQRSPDRGGGWRTCSATCWPLVEGLPSEPVELAPAAGGGGQMRLTEKRSEEHTSELQSLMRISYAVFCLKKKKTEHTTKYTHIHQIQLNTKSSTHT